VTDPDPHSPMGVRTWRLSRAATLPLDRPRLLGILNVTPDSFSDGGRYTTDDTAAAHAQRLVEDGADIIDIGGESTRPGAPRVPAQEQIARVIPIIHAIRARAADVRISIDTTLAPVAAAALDAGATVVNDVSAGLDDPAMLALVAERGCGVILMHRLRPPPHDAYSHQHHHEPDYGPDGVIGAVVDFLAARLAAARAAGIAPDSIVVDPGLGFGKSVAQNFRLIAHIGEVMSLGVPVLSAASRKSFIGAVAGEPDPALRVAGSIAISVAHALEGVRLFRVHDVREHAQALRATSAIIAGAEAPKRGSE